MKPSRVLAVLSLLLTGFGATGVVHAQSVKLNRLPVRVRGDVKSFVLTPDGSRVVYTAHLREANGFELYVVPVDGSEDSLRLTELANFAGPEADFQVTSDGVHAVYRAGATGKPRLFSVPLSGGPSIRLDAPAMSSGEVFEFALSPAGDRVVYWGEQDASWLLELYSVPVTGGPPVKLNQPGLVPFQGVDLYGISPDGTRVAFVAENPHRMFTRSIDGTGAVTDLTPPDIHPESDALEFAFTPDSTRLVFRGDLTNNSRDELYSAPPDGSQPAIQLSPLVTAGDVTEFRIGPDGRVVYRADAITDELYELWAVRADMIGGVTRLNATLPAGGDVEGGFAVSTTRVVYLGGQETAGLTELFSVPLDASAPPVKLSGTLVSGGAVREVWISPDETRVLYRADQDVVGREELYSVPIDGSAPAVRVNGPLIADGDVVEVRLTPMGDRVLFRADADVDELFELWSAQLDGSGTPVLLSGILDPEGDVRRDFDVTPDGQLAVYRADPAEDEVVQMFVAPADGSDLATVLNGPLAVEEFGGVGRWAVAPQGDQVAFQMTDDWGTGLYVVRNDGGLPQTRLVNPAVIDVNDFRYTADGTRLIYRGFGNGFAHLYCQAADGSGPAKQLTQTVVSGGYIEVWEPTGDEARVVYVADHLTDNHLELLSVPLDGSQPPVVLSDPSIPWNIYDGNGNGFFAISPDNTRVSYLHPSLHVVPVDGSAAPILLASAAGIGYSVNPYSAVRPPLQAISSDSDHVVFVGPRNTPQVYELFTVPIDGSAPPVAINGTLVANGDVQWMKVAPGGRVLYIADQEVDERFELYSVPADGSQPSTKLSGTMLPAGDISPPVDGHTSQVPIRISPDGSLVLFTADREANDVFELYVVPIDGSLPPRKMNDPLSAGRRVPEFEFDPSGQFVVFLADPFPVPFGAYELWVAPVDGSVAPLSLSGPMIPGGQGRYFDFSTRPGYVLYVARQHDPDRDNLYLVPLDGSAPPRRVDGPPTFLTIADFEVSADASIAVFHVDGFFAPDELYAAFLGRPHRRIDPPDLQTEQDAR